MSDLEEHTQLGRPTKKTPQRCRALYKAIEEGLPFIAACQSAGISYESFKLWRRTDPRFAQAVDLAEAKSIEANFKYIKDARSENWPAAAWLLERRHPELFSRPEVQLNLAVQNNIAQRGNGNGPSFQQVVVSDLEFLNLRDHPDYKYTPAQPVLEVRAETVPEELSGSLSKQGCSGTVVSQSAAEARAKRAAEIRAKTIKLVEDHEAAR